MILFYLRIARAEGIDNPNKTINIVPILKIIELLEAPCDVEGSEDNVHLMAFFLPLLSPLLEAKFKPTIAI